MREIEVVSSQPDKRWDDLNLMEKLVAVDGLLPHDITSLIPRHLDAEEFVSGLKAAESIEHKGALWWGSLYRAGVEIYGQDFYQHLDGFTYQKSTLQNYARLTTQIHPSLWSEDIPDRHFMAIGQNVKDPEEQKRWVQYARMTGVSGDQLRDEIHANHEQRGLRPKSATATWHECEHCHGRGGWLEEEEN